MGWLGSDAVDVGAFFVQACDQALTDWAAEKQAIAASKTKKDSSASMVEESAEGDRAAIDDPTEAASAAASSDSTAPFVWKYPIYDRFYKSRLLHWTFASDEAWQARLVEKEKAKAAAAAQQAANKAKLQKQREAAAAKKGAKKEAAAAVTASTHSSSAAESKALKKQREATERAEALAKEVLRLARQAERESTEPYYFVAADDSILMNYLDSEEEEAWVREEDAQHHSHACEIKAADHVLHGSHQGATGASAISQRSYQTERTRRDSASSIRCTRIETACIRRRA